MKGSVEAQSKMSYDEKRKLLYWLFEGKDINYMEHLDVTGTIVDAPNK